jgi:crotonobetainyl-CoA:carnitine CoA-transferase CaiB-like acyl-CoA transferase
METSQSALEHLWSLAGGEAGAPARVALAGADPVLPTGVRIGTAATAVIAATALAATEVWRLRTGRTQAVAVDMRAAVAAFRSERYLRVDGGPAPDRASPLFGFYPTAGGRWAQIHANLPHHHAGHVKFLACEETRESMAAAIARWRGPDLEDALNGAGLPAALVRSRQEWLAHPHGQAVAGLPLLEIVRIGDSPPEPPGRGDRPLSGVRVLDLTRVIAGPECGRTLASHGADVLLVTSPHLPNLPSLVIDFGLGKLSAALDLRRAAGAERLRGLIAGADVFSQSYRPGALGRLGFGPEEVARLRPGIVYVTLSAYGHVGPWRERRGFETLVQSVTGLAHEQGLGAGLDRPQHLPAQVVDHATGCLGALGAIMALVRRAREGGSYLVRVSLAQTARWVDGLGRVSGHGVADQTLAGVQDLLAECDSPFGRLRYVAPAARLSETPASWSRPPGRSAPTTPPGRPDAAEGCGGAREPGGGDQLTWPSARSRASTASMKAWASATVRRASSGPMIDATS